MRDRDANRAARCGRGARAAAAASVAAAAARGERRAGATIRGVHDTLACCVVTAGALNSARCWRAEAATDVRDRDVT